MKTFKLISKVFLCLFCLFATEKGWAQNVGISTTSGFTPDASAGLDISYTNKGLLVPRVALTATSAAGPITSPAISLLVYNTATAGTAPNNVVPGYYYWNGTAWTALSTGTQTANQAWSITGNAGTTAGPNFIGTTDAVDFVIKTSGTERARVTGTGNQIGNFGIGNFGTGGTSVFNTTNPEKLLVDAGTTSSSNVISGKGNINNYLQLNIQNLNAGTAASSDVVATADNGTEAVNYIDMGINSSANTSTGVIGGVNTAYLYGTGSDFAIGNAASGKNLLFFNGGTGAYEKMRIAANGKVGINIQDPANPLVVKDTLEIRRTGTMSELLFSNTGGTGDMRIAGDGGDIYWQGGGGRNLQMGSYWTTILGGDRQTGIPAFSNGIGGTGVLVLSQRDASVPLAIQANSPTQTANLTEWRTSSGTVLSAMTQNGNFGIGTTSPATKLHVFGANPLTLSGVVTGTNTSADSLLTITNGLVRKLPMSTFAAASTNAWSTTGNTGTTAGTNFIGTTDATDFVVKTNNIERERISSAGNVAIGGTAFNTSNPEQLLVDAGTTSSTNVISGKGSINSFLQLNIQNLSSGTSASTDVVATADNGTDAANYVDMGINSSGNTAYYFGGANDAYLYNAGGTANGGNFYIGTSTAAKSLGFLTGGGAASNIRMVINGSGNVGIGTTAPGQKLEVNGNIYASSGSLYSKSSVVTDFGATNAGTVTPGLQLGGTSSGEGISSKRTTGTNQFGLDFYTASTNRMAITQAGSVGIGTTTPQATLDIAGTVNVGVGGTTLNNIMRGSFTITNSTAITNGDKQTSTVAITGITTGANIMLNPTAPLPGAIAIASVRVSSAGNITIAFVNTSTTALALGTVTFNYTIIQ